MPNARRTVPFTREPLAIASGIPVFIVPDAYTLNYEKIAADHLAALDSKGVNPFIAEDTWAVLDGSTRLIIKDHLRPGDVILDAGVGLGRLLSSFPQNERHGVDVSQRYLERTQAHGIHVALAKLEDLPYPDCAFDMVVSTDVLEHVLDFYNATKEMVRVLKPGGVLVARVPLEEDMRVYYDYRDYDLVHVRRFDLWGLRLHFERVLGLDYLLDQPVLPTYRGIGTARLQPLDDGAAVRALLETLPENMPGLADLRSFSRLTAASFEFFMNSAAANHPEIFEKLTPLLAKHLEINVVFRKHLA